jgi:hypothetical protein
MSSKVALVSSTVVLTGACPTGATIVDFVGYGTSAVGGGNTPNCVEGAGPAPLIDLTKAAVRKLNGCVDSGNNNLDFVVDAAPVPRNSASPKTTCTACAA